MQCMREHMESGRGLLSTPLCLCVVFHVCLQLLSGLRLLVKAGDQGPPLNPQLAASR